MLCSHHAQVPLEWARRVDCQSLGHTGDGFRLRVLWKHDSNKPPLELLGPIDDGWEGESHCHVPMQCTRSSRSLPDAQTPRHREARWSPGRRACTPWFGLQTFGMPLRACTVEGQGLGHEAKAPSI